MQTQRKSVPPSINEAMIERHFALDPTTRETLHDPALTQLRDAVQAARVGAEKARRVADAILRNDMLTVPARHRQVKGETWRAVEGALRKLDAARSAAAQEVRAIEARTKAPPRPTDPAGAMLASEIRARLASMPPAARRKAMDGALADGDDTVLGAVLNGPPMLSGLSGSEEFEMVRSSWQRSRHGDDIDRLSRLSRALVDSERAGTLVIGFMVGLYSSKAIEQAEATEQAVATALQS